MIAIDVRQSLGLDTLKIPSPIVIVRFRRSSLTVARGRGKLRQMAVRHTPKGRVKRVGASPAGSPDGETAVLESPTAASLVHTLVPGADTFGIRDAILQRLVSGARLRLLRNELHLSIEAIGRLLDIAPRTINRIETTAQPLSVAGADRAFRIARIGDLAIELIGDREKGLAWLNRPNTSLRGKKPIEMLDTEIGADLVSQSLHAIAYGGIA